MAKGNRVQPAAQPVLKKGDSGPRVRELSGHLVERRLLLRATTDFDNSVKLAVQAFQASHVGPNGLPLEVDGKVGELTWWALRSTNDSAVIVTPTSTNTPSIPSGGSPVGRAALRVALDEMADGSEEKRRNNSGPFVKKYLNGLSDEGVSWCAGFVSWCFSQSRQGIPFNYSLGAQDIRNQFKRRGWTFELAQQTPEPGDIVVWYRKKPTDWQGHIGFVLRVENGLVYTVEGNKGNYPAPVREFNYTLGRMEKLLGFGRAE